MGRPKIITVKSRSHPSKQQPVQFIDYLQPVRIETTTETVTREFNEKISRNLAEQEHNRGTSILLDRSLPDDGSDRFGLT